jgi:hypothetical protein
MLPRLPGLLFSVLVSVSFVACQPVAFDPTGPCDVDGRMAGAYPDLERLLPATFRGEAPDQRDSGRNCTPAALGPLAGFGIAEVRFAGAIWQTGAQSGVTLAVFQGAGLDASKMLSFYEAGARSARRVERLETTETERDGRSFHRLDALNDGSDQTVVTWDDGDVVRVVLVADSVGEVASASDHEDTVAEALEAAGA